MSHDRGCGCGREKYEADDCTDPYCKYRAMPVEEDKTFYVMNQTMLSLDQNKRQDRWDRDFLALARFWADIKSKDPSTKVGAVLVDEKNRILSMGYNGFPRGVDDTPERYANRETKLSLVVHAEANALLNMPMVMPEYTTLYCTLFPCNECAKLIIQAGVWRVVAPDYNIPGKEKWLPIFETSRMMLNEARVMVDIR